ncbi:hypothetical protein SO802_011302 [Lithocarpus litseifolius]|uniref:Transcription factor CBF/NF-Y/archaeal histone domain-containing protein n=1 Tax=Lithocarpus litseifolius TaxID=425828 RepID=A0AAW2D4Y0_9ROSI
MKPKSKQVKPKLIFFSSHVFCISCFTSVELLRVHNRSRFLVKKIRKLDNDINKVNSEALFLIPCSAELFLQFLAEKSTEITTERKRKIVKLEHIQIAVKKHQPTSDFLYVEFGFWRSWA